jgi:hypothetical protein
MLRETSLHIVVAHAPDVLGLARLFQFEGKNVCEAVCYPFAEGGVRNHGT